VLRTAVTEVAADIAEFTHTTTFAIMQSLRLDKGPSGPAHPGSPVRRPDRRRRTRPDRGRRPAAIRRPGLLAAADHLIDMGPVGGPDGGRILAAGTPEQVARDPGSVTGPWLAEHLGPPDKDS
jgi:hypothetical protein